MWLLYRQVHGEGMMVIVFVGVVYALMQVYIAQTTRNDGNARRLR